MQKTLQSILGQALNYLPGLVILVVGMIALQASVMLMDQHEELFFEHIDVGHISTQANQDEISENITRPHKRLYWSVIALGLCGFVLIILNAYKMRELSHVTEDKKKALKLLESRLQAMEASRDGIGIVDPAGKLTYMNSALMDLHGVTADNQNDFINQPWEKIYSEAGQENITENILPALQDKRFWRGEAPVRRHDGEIVEAELSLTLLEDGSIIGTARDITKRKKAEIEKEDLQKQFFQAQKMEAIGRLAGGIAHDFNNILAAINGYAEFLSDDLEEGSSLHKFATNILKAGHQAQKLVDEILTFSRIKGNNFETLNLSQTLRETLNMFDITLPKTVSLKTKIPDTEYTVLGHRDHISQMAMNMYVNALDAIEDKGDSKGTISVSMIPADDNFFNNHDLKKGKALALPDAEHRVNLHEKPDGTTRLILGSIDQEKDYVVFGVQDSGSGMTRETLEHVFEPFFTTKSVEKGTGLGMSMAHGVVQSHRATMIIETKIREGTVFYVLFPLSSSTVAEMSGKKADKNIKTELSGHILLVEDQEDVAQMTQVMLERIGFEVTWRENGQIALSHLREVNYQYDLVLTDHNMPEMTGLELAIEAEKDEFPIPFVMLSGYSEKKLRGIIEQNKSIHAVLRKPITQNDLAATLQEVLKH